MEQKLHRASDVPVRHRHKRGVQKVLQLDYIEEWKCYKLNFIFQYNLY